MGISFDQIKPLKEGEYSPVYLALLLRDIADKAVGKVTGTEDTEHVPDVWLHISNPMLKAPRFTGNEGFKGASERARTILKLLIPKAEEYIAAAHILDNFKDHEERREWGHKNIVKNPEIKDENLRMALRNFFKKNKLNINNFAALLSGFRLLQDEFSKMDCAEARYVVWAYQHSGEPGALPASKKTDNDTGSIIQLDSFKYDQLTSREKWEIARAFEVVCYKLLELVADAEHMELEVQSRSRAA